jgi:hypothetical protein
VLADEAMKVGFQGLTRTVDAGRRVEEAGHGGPRIGDRAASLRKG